MLYYITLYSFQASHQDKIRTLNDDKLGEARTNFVATWAEYFDRREKLPSAGLLRPMEVPPMNSDEIAGHVFAQRFKTSTWIIP